MTLSTISPFHFSLFSLTTKVLYSLDKDLLDSLCSICNYAFSALLTALRIRIRPSDFDLWESKLDAW